MLKSFGVAIVAFGILDFLWLGLIMKDFNMRHLAEIGRFENGQMQIQVLPAMITYLLMALAVTFFVQPQTVAFQETWKVFLLGAFLGTIVFGVFDMTNLAIIKGYPTILAVVDTAWGTFAFGLVSVAVHKANTYWS